MVSTYSRESRYSPTTPWTWLGSNGRAPRRSRLANTLSCLTSPMTARASVRATGVLSVDGKTLDTKKIPHTIPFLMSIDETFDIGVDTRTPVDDKDYQVPFRFTGKIAKLTFKLGPEQLVEQDREVMQKALARAKD